MSLFQFNIESNSWFIPACIIISGLLTYFLYSKKENWSSRVNYILAALRFSSLFLICFLFLSPFFNYVKNHFEKPSLAIIIDNSSSLLESSDSIKIKQSISSLSKSLNDIGILPVIHDLTKQISLDSLQFNGDETNLSEAITNAKEEYYNRNLAGVLLISDGIHNKGIKPDNKNFRTNIFTIGLGDTTSRNDLIINSVKINKTAYVKNDFPIKTTISCKGYENVNSQLKLFRNDTLIQEQEVTLNKSSPKDITFYTSEAKTGSYTYTVVLNALEDEISTKNNSKTLFIEIVNNKEKVLLYAQAPHPDLKVLKSIIDKTDKYELDLFIEGIHNKEFNINNYHLAILHQTPIKRTNKNLDKIIQSDISKLYVLGNQTLTYEFNKHNKTVQILENSNQKDEVGAYLNNELETFTLDNSYINNLLTNAPPVEVPFGDYVLKGNATIILGQKIGSIETTKPLLILNQTGDFKEGVLIGEGYWKWNLFEYIETGEHKLLNEILSKSIQFLSSKNDKRQLITSAEKSLFYTSEPTRLNIETYNELHEKVNNIPTEINVFDTKGNKQKFSVITSKNKTVYSLNYMKEGRYSYSSKATIAGKTHTSNGGFFVEKKKIEATDIQANHLRLQKIATNNNGIFTTLDATDLIITEIKNRSYSNRIHSQEEYQPLRDNWIYLLIIIALLATEWSVRKAKGSY